PPTSPSPSQMHDLSASPRRSLPATPKPHKKVGAPKAKGAVRAKSGCYTCRIRRKKCDEQPNEEGRCQTCIRLRLQCLGFGQKRPEWLKNNNVTVFREKIKDFLAAQGMIKGHSGSGTRSSEQEGMLVLVTESGRSDSSSPQSPTLSATSSSDDHRPSGLAISNERMMHYPPISMPPSQQYSSGMYAVPEYSSLPVYSLATGYNPISDIGSESLHPGREHMLAPPPSSNELMLPFNPPSTIMQPIATLPTHFTSSLSQSYHQQYPFDVDVDERDYAPEAISPEYYIPPTISTSFLPSIPYAQNGLVRHYLDHVLMRQYLLADKSISEFIVRTIQKSPAVRDAVCLLASLHQESLHQGARVQGNLIANDGVSVDYDKTFNRICASLRRTSGRQYNEDDALTGLLVVSAFLFRGGRGAWLKFLTVASDWVFSVLHQYPDTKDFLLHCTDSQRFIIKTTFWFDILASTTRLKPPRFVRFYRNLWAQPSAYIDDGLYTTPHLSMLTVMGCDNTTALAIAEISSLAAWKEEQTRDGTLSVPALVDKGRQIENDYLVRASPTQMTAAYGLPFDEDEIAMRRRLTSDIFRATAKVYLHSVLSGEYPLCPEIREGVAEMIQCLQSVPAAQSSLSSSVLRSVVFGICLAGCLTDDWEERRFILHRLQEEQNEGVGNCAEARAVMERVWERRAESAGQPVSWRDAMQQFGGETLLLV
ncbi:hypothetical protein BV25DRAFT_1794791, partial [Artomyces pyxidatus]